MRTTKTTAENKTEVDAKLEAQGLRRADFTGGEPGWFVTVWAVKEGREQPVKIWATDEPAR